VGQRGRVDAGGYAVGVERVPLLIEPDPDDPGCASIYVDGTVAGRPYRFLLDTGAARTQLTTDEYTGALSQASSDSSAGAFSAPVSYPVVTITDLAVGPLRAAPLEVTRVDGNGPHVQNILGMDVLSQHCCHFRLDAGALDIEASPGHLADRDLTLDRRGHVYVAVHWPDVTAHACWDTGAGATLVNRGFWLAHPELFEQVGTSVGTDVSGAQTETPTLVMAETVIGGRAFGPHPVVAVDLSAPNGPTDIPMDLILGYPTLRQADWLMDFPARRWTITRATRR
jgi:gag-polyprotein putative aspartyl protease